LWFWCCLFVFNLMPISLVILENLVVLGPYLVELFLVNGHVFFFKSALILVSQACVLITLWFYRCEGNLSACCCIFGDNTFQ
jgi:hypothetical protein